MFPAGFGVGIGESKRSEVLDVLRAEEGNQLFGGVGSLDRSDRVGRSIDRRGEQSDCRDRVGRPPRRRAIKCSEVLDSENLLISRMLVNPAGGVVQSAAALGRRTKPDGEEGGGCRRVLGASFYLHNFSSGTFID